MPLVTEVDRPRKRHIPRWVRLATRIATCILVVVLVGLAGLAGLVAWSWDHPVTLRVGNHSLGFGYSQSGASAYLDDYYSYMRSPPDGNRFVLRLWSVPAPLGNDQYLVWQY